MRVLAQTAESNIATVYLAEDEEGHYFEFVESVQPPLPRSTKWVIIISSLFGCPVNCKICDAGFFYKGVLSTEQMLAQIEYLVEKRYPDKKIDCDKFKIQFARMGEPVFNDNVISVLQELPCLYPTPGLLPSLSTIAPQNREAFFVELLSVKKKLFNNRFQLQFSIHTTDEKLRDWLIPVKKWSFSEIADYCQSFHEGTQQRISLNFALLKGMPLDVSVLLKFFSPEKFLVKLTPVNPTIQSIEFDLKTVINPQQKDYTIIDELEKEGYKTILSIGEWEENKIGSNCGQLILNHLQKNQKRSDCYTYPLEQSDSQCDASISPPGPYSEAIS